MFYILILVGIYSFWCGRKLHKKNLTVSNVQTKETNMLGEGVFYTLACVTLLIIIVYLSHLDPNWFIPNMAKAFCAGFFASCVYSDYRKTDYKRTTNAMSQVYFILWGVLILCIIFPTDVIIQHAK